MTMVKENLSYGLFKVFGVHFFSSEIILFDDLAFAYEPNEKTLYYYIPYQGWNRIHFSFAHPGSSTSKYTDSIYPTHLAKAISIATNNYFDCHDTRMTKVIGKNFRLFLAKNKKNDFFGCTVGFSYKLKTFTIENIFKL